MKKLIITISLFFCLFLYSCSRTYERADIVTEKVDANSFLPIELALQEFAKITSELKNCEFEVSYTMARSDIPNNTVIEFAYTSDNGDGIYGFEYSRDDNGNYELIQQGDYITVNNIVTLISLKEEQQEAYLNCLKYISNSSFDWKSLIKTTIVSVNDLTKEMYDSVWSADGDEKILDINTNYLLFTIGDTSDHNFFMLVCDSETNDVIGYIPID